MKFNSNRSIAILYPCGVCNLNCRYCQIDKNPVLKDIDAALEDSFKGDYYFNRIKEYFPRRDMLKRVETWGGEPFLHMDRVYPLVHQLINYYPYFMSMFSSTNFAYDSWFDQFIGLMNCFAKYPDRNFTYELQLSVDGPPYINDRNRGEGVTDRCIKNFNKLINYIKADKFPKNIMLMINLKGTWDLQAIYDLNNKDKLIEFYQFYENTYLENVIELKKDNIQCFPSIPNVAVPSPVTKADGKIFAELVKKCREIEQENLVYHYFKYYNFITPFMSNNVCNTTYVQQVCTCGTGDSLVGFLPNNMMSSCHEGFVQFVERYKQYASTSSKTDKVICFDQFVNEQTESMCLSDDGYELHEFKMSMYNCDSPSRLATDTAMIMALAMADLIDDQYLDEKRALFAASAIQNSGAYCIKDNYNVTGSFTIQPDGMFKLLLNGALEYLTPQMGGFNEYTN